MLTLTERITKSFNSRKLSPMPELLKYARSCDLFATGNLTDSALQDELCDYLDTTALRVRSISEALGRVKEPLMSEVVTESVNMLVDSILRRSEFLHLQLSISSERNVKLPAGGYRKPDVGVWQKDKLKLVVECKTSLGRKRNEWLQDYNDRVQEFQSIGLVPSSLLLFVATDQTWKGFPKDDLRVRKSWFSLCQSGSWFGGGKTGEIPLLQKQHQGIVENFRSSIANALLL
jgi:hypothetical protein